MASSIRKQICLWLVICLGMLPIVTVLAQVNRAILSVKPYSSVKQVPVGKSFKVALRVNLNSGYHINSNEPLDDNLVATRLAFAPVRGVVFGEVIYPEADLKTLGFSDTEVAIFENSCLIYAEVTVKEDCLPGVVHLRGVFSYQACTDANCFLPQEEKFELPIEIVRVGEPLSLINEEIFEVQPVAAIPKSTPLQNLQLTTEENRAQEVLAKGMFYAVAAFFLFGLALNLTPCVYPVIPITVSYFGTQVDRQKGKRFLNALVYVLGIALVFSLLGLVSGLAGKQWGFLFQNPWFVIVITVIILAMAASMFGAFEITVPAFLMNRFGRAREGVLGALVMGLTVGVVITPCAAGIIIGLVGLVAKLGMVVKGTILFFIMGVGLGVPYLVLATFSGLMQRLPHSGMWMVWVRKLFGVLLIGVALYFFLPQASHIGDMQGFFLGLLAIFGGLLLGFLDHAPGYSQGFKIGRSVFGVILILLGIYLANGAIHHQSSGIAWRNYSDENVTELIQSGKPVFIDFYADWCAPCKEMDRKTFSDPRVMKKSEQLTMVKIDCTTPNRTVQDFMNRFHVTGMPTLLFLDRAGKEIDRLRAIGFVDAETFLRHIETALTGK